MNRLVITCRKFNFNLMEPIKKTKKPTQTKPNQTKPTHTQENQPSIEKMDVINYINFIISFRIILSMTRE